MIFNEVNVTTSMDHFHDETFDHRMEALTYQVFSLNNLLKMDSTKGFINQNFKGKGFH